MGHRYHHRHHAINSWRRLERLEAALCRHRTRRRDGVLLTAYAQNVAAFGAGAFVLGLICALLRIGRNAFRYAGLR
jgi:hypothetical protein